MFRIKFSRLGLRGFQIYGNVIHRPFRGLMVCQLLFRGYKSPQCPLCVSFSACVCARESEWVKGRTLYLTHPTHGCSYVCSQATLLGTPCIYTHCPLYRLHLLHWCALQVQDGPARWSRHASTCSGVLRLQVVHGPTQLQSVKSVKHNTKQQAQSWTVQKLINKGTHIWHLPALLTVWDLT